MNTCRHRGALALTTATLLGASASAQDPAARPSYAVLRQNEDWSSFRGGEAPGDTFDRLKRVPLSSQGDVWASFGGRIETRFESWENFGFDEDFDDTYFVSRAFLHGDLHVGETFRLFVEGKSAQATDRDLPGGRRPIDMDTLDLQQAFVDIVIPVGEGKLRLRPGRQMLLFGAQRLVSPLAFVNSMRTFEGATAEWRQGDWTITGLWTAFVPVDKTGSNEAEDDITLFGVYARNAAKGAKDGFELFALGNERPNVNINGTAGDEDRVTLGARVFAPFAGSFDYEVEAAYQTGEVGDGDVSAWSIASQVGSKLEDLPGAPRFFVGLDAASGDDEVGGDVETFHQLFPLGHAYLGFIDYVGRQNVLAFSGGGKWGLGAGTSFLAQGHLFRAMETSDALYDAGGAPLRSGFDSRDIGAELDLLVEAQLERHLEAYGGYSHFFPGDAIGETGPDEGVDFLYLGLKYVF